ncbi:MAG: beta-lactamase family protein [Chitinispirillaceae bacterium]|jgi:CubicO group peptidase (beta-lactamase class C family)|nr:beta-lactamase family protein [Chitinispirillaceae bacterium]
MKSFLEQCITEKIFPGCVVGIVDGGRGTIECVGKLTYDDAPAVTENTLYDVASITKAVPTSCLALKLVEEGWLSLDSRLIDFVPEYSGEYRKLVRLEHLLTQTLDFDFRLSDRKNCPPAEIIQAICSAPLRTPPGSAFSYANATSILLGLVVERAAGMTLDKAAKARFFDPLGMTRTTFSPLKDDPVIAPTENDPWRGRLVRGEVHDESAWALRPAMVAGSAGLFSTAPDLMRFLTMLLDNGVCDGVRYFKPETIRLMHTNALPAGMQAKTALGWELDQESFMGTRRSQSTFGKTGFTGCAIVADPALKKGFVFLNNHIHPARLSDRSVINQVRSRLADIVFG